AASWFGRVNLCAPRESWPRTNGEPMHALCQINLSEMPFRPPRLEDVELLTVFIGPKELPFDAPNGTNWCLRAYPSLRNLVPIAQLKTGSQMKPFPLRPIVVESDFPNW